MNIRHQNTLILRRVNSGDRDLDKLKQESLLRTFDNLPPEQQESIASQVQRLETIKGIGEVSALELIMVLGNMFSEHKVDGGIERSLVNYKEYYGAVGERSSPRTKVYHPSDDIELNTDIRCPDCRQYDCCC